MLELLNIFVDNMIPVLAIAAVGVVLRRHLHVDPAMVSRMMFTVFAPALAFDAVFTSDISGGDFLRVYFGYTGAHGRGWLVSLSSPSLAEASSFVEF